MSINYIEQYKIDLKICDDLISYFKEKNEYKASGMTSFNTIRYDVKKSTDVCVFNNSNDQRIKNFFMALTTCIQPYCKKYELKHRVKTELCNNIQHYKAGEGYFATHYERDSISSSTRELAYMVYHNTLTDKGGTFFPRHKKTIEPIKGKTVIWPAGFTHPHRGVISPTQEKYIATGWFVIQ